MLCIFKSVLPPLVRFSCDLDSPFPSRYWKGHTLVNGAFLINGIPYKGVTSVLRASPVSAVSQNNQLKIIPLPKSHIFGWHILLSFTTVPIYWISLLLSVGTARTVSQDQYQVRGSTWATATTKSESSSSRTQMLFCKQKEVNIWEPPCAFCVKNLSYPKDICWSSPDRQLSIK